MSGSTQKFEDPSGKPLASIVSHTDRTLNSRYVLWDEVEKTLANISHLQDTAAQRVFFEVDKEYNLYVSKIPLRVVYSSIPYVAVVRAEEVDGQARARRWPLTFQKEAINSRTWLKAVSKNKDRSNATSNNHLDSLLEIISEAQEHMALRRDMHNLSEQNFLKAVATSDYYKQSLLTKIDSLRSVDSSLKQELGKIVDELALLDQELFHLHEHHRLNKCQAIMDTSDHSLEYPAPHLFLVLPSNLALWNDMDPATHNLRLYFMCDPSRLESIVGTLEGKLDRCLSTIVVPLSSVAQVMDIATALLQIKSVYDVTIRLNWIVSRDELRDVLSLMARSGVAALQLDGLTSKTRVHNFENEEDLFVEAIGFSVLQLAALLNYPQSSEQYVYLGQSGSDVYGLQLRRSVELPHFDWLNMRIALDRELSRITDKKNISFVEPSLKDFFCQLVFETDLDVRGVDLFDSKTRMWQGRLGVKDDVVIGLSDTIVPSSKLCTSILEYGTLRALRLKTEDTVDIPYLCSLIELNPGLQYLDIPAQEEHIFKYLRPVDLAEVRLENIQLQDHGDWNVIIGAIDFATLKSLSFLNSAVANVDNVDTLVDRLKEQLPDLELIVFTSSLEEKRFTFISLLGTTIVSETQYHELEIEGIDWDPTCDIWHTLAPVSEGFQYGVVRATSPHDPASPRVLKNASSARHPFSLSALDLNIVCLTMRGLASLRNVLQRSTLEHLKINCVPISKELWDDVFQLLKSLRPATLKSLVLVGDNIDEWLWLWVKGSSHPSLHGSMSDQLYLCPVLQKLKIAGAQKLQPLGRKSASFILHLIRSSQLEELRLLNIEIVHEDDWDLIAGTIEKSRVTSLELSSRLQALMKKHFWYHFRRSKAETDSLTKLKMLGFA
ncbi:hypothetical protein BGZ59_002292 [Podila verticillata]|nr:hypothetical protein BGZ59_002292 [Podila verticillata]